MNATRIWTIAGSAVIAAILVLGWFVVVSPALAQAATNDSDRAAVAAQNETYAAQLAQLKADYANLGSLREELAELDGEVPTFMDNSDLILTIAAAAGATGATVTGIQPEPPKLFEQATPNATTPAEEVPPTDPEGTEPADGAAEPAPDSAPASAPAGPGGVVPISPADAALATTGDFFTSNIDIKLNADLAQALAMVKLLQTSERVFLITSVESAAAGGEGPEATIKAIVYVHKDPTGVVLGQQNKAHGKPGDPATTPTPTPTPTETPTPEPTETPAP